VCKKINIRIHLFTEPSPVSQAQRQASYHQSLLLETECHLQQFPHNWILQPDAKPQEKQQQCMTNVNSKTFYYAPAP